LVLVGIFLKKLYILYKQCHGQQWEAPNQKQHQQFLDIINDNSLTQVVNKTTRKDKTLDLILTNYPAK
jgi:adenine C2-methylase RlmN of 23S rRNA A2503 and tRNA A37